MHRMLLTLFAFAAASVEISLSQNHEQRDSMLNTGPACISYVDPRVGLRSANSVTHQYSSGGPALSQVELTTCLNEYGCGTFSNSWNGNVCGGRGWFKGPPGSKISSAECFQVLAPWVLLNGIWGGNTYYKAMLGKHDCYLGYNEPEPDRYTR